MVEQSQPKKKTGRPPKNAVPRSERVTMMWTPTLKERVRERVGTRGLTDWVIDAVEEKLATAPPRTIEEMRQLQERKAKRDDDPVPADEPDEQWGTQPVVSQPSRVNGRPVEEVEAPLLEPVTERFGSSTGGVSDLLSRAAAIGVNTTDIHAAQAPPVIVDSNACPTCGEQLIDDECWTCD